MPPEGEVVYLRKTANLSTGGTAIDVTDVIHPDNKLMAERAIRAVGLDIGGVDFLTTDITQSYRDTGGAICEINAGPGMRMHIAPSEGKGRDVGGAVMDMLFPAGHARAHPDRGADRHQRQDHHRADAGARPEDGRPRRRPDLDRRRLHRRQRHGEGRHDRPDGRRHGAARPDRSTWR